MLITSGLTRLRSRLLKTPKLPCHSSIFGRAALGIGIFTMLLMQPDGAQAACSTTGTNPVVVTCAANTTTTNTANTTTPNANTSDRSQTFASDITATVNSGIAITGAGLAPISTLNGSTVSLINNGSITSNVNAAAAVEGSGSNFTLTYSGSGNITGTGTAGALQLLGAGTGSSTATVSGTSTLTTAVSGGLFVAPGLQTGGTSGTVNVTVQSGGTVLGSNAIEFDGTGSNTLTNSGAVGSVAAGTLTTNGVAANTLNNNSITVVNHGTGTITGSITGILTGASGSVALTNDTGGQIIATNTTLQAGANAASVGISAGSVTGSNAGTISGSTHGIDTSGSLPGSSPGTLVNLTSNSGTIQGTATVGSGFKVGSGILAETSVTVGTNSGTISGGLNGIATINSFVTVNSNSGAITGLSGAGISAATTADVTNATGGQITGVTAGIIGANVTASNSGTISATTGSGIVATTGALSVTNNTGATISGGGSGIVSGGTSASVNNSGLVTGAGSGISLQAGTSDITNNSGATISGTGVIGFGIQSLTGVAVTLANAGTVSGTFAGIGSGGDVNVTSNSNIITGANAGINASGAVNVTNNTGGQITATGPSGVAISASTGIVVANAGTISGGTGGALNTSGGVTLTSNTGNISSTGITIFTAGTTSVTNNTGGTISTNGGTAAIFVSGAAATVVNSGSITATGAGTIGIAASGVTITNNSGATISGGLDGVNQQASLTSSITNMGTISGAGRSGVRMGSNASVTNIGTGLITGLTGIVFRDPTATNTPVVNGSVFNSGTITGTGGTAINFALTPGSGPFTLTLGPGSIINGTVLGTGGDTFQLGGATGSDTFNVSNIGASQQYRGFTTFNKIGASTWTLTGAGTQNWTVSQGTLIGDTNSLAGSVITDNASLVYSQTFSGVHSGLISGTGTLTKAGSGTVILTADNNYSGGTTISAGTLQLGNATTTGSIVGDVLDNGVLAINHTNAFAFSGAISGTGAFQQNGSGTTTLTGASTYTGGTTIAAGVLQLGNGGTTGSIVGNVLDNGVFAINHSNAVTFDGAISGTGAFQQNGAGTTTLTGASTYTGGTTITSGVLQLGNGGTTGSIVGNVLDNGVFAINHSDAFAFGGVISGTGAFQQNGNGTTDLSANNSYTGATAVNGGILQVDGSIASSSLTTVNANAALTGVGTVGNTMIASGGIFAPGNGTPGTFMSVNGSLAFQSGAQYLVLLNPATASFASVTGTATLGNATVDAMFANGSYVAKKYTILTANGGVSGTFGSLVNTNLPANFSASLSYDAHDAFLDLNMNFVTPGGLNGNQQNVANALTNFFNSSGSIPLVFGALNAAGLTQASGETATGTQQTTFDAMGLFMGLLTDPFIAGRGDPISAGGGPTAYAGQTLSAASRPTDAFAMFTKAPLAAPFVPSWSVWTAGFGGSQTTDGNAALGSNTATSRIAGAAVGADYRFSPNTIAGFALAGGGTNFTIANALGTGRSDLFQAGAYLRHTAGPAYISAALAYGWQDVTTNRTVTIAGIDQLQARFNANAFSGRAEGGYRFVTPWMGVTPYAAAQFTTFDLPAYAEQAIVGSNTFALAYGAKDVTDSRSELGIRTDKSFAMTNSILTLRGRLAWAHDFNPDRNIGATFQALPGASFVVNGAAQAHDSALTTASAEVKWMNGWSAAATFEGEFSEITRSYAGKGVVRYTW